MIKYFIKEMSSPNYGSEYEIGKFDADKTFQGEGVEYLANVISVSIDRRFVRMSYDTDFIGVDELEDLKYITAEQYADWRKLLDEFEATCELNLKQILFPPKKMTND